jgi:hypothetical protein
MGKMHTNLHDMLQMTQMSFLLPSKQLLPLLIHPNHSRSTYCQDSMPFSMMK